MAKPVKPLWKVSVETSQEGEEAAAELLSRVFRSAASVYVDVETQRCWASVFVPAISPRALTQVRTGMKELQDAGLCMGPGFVTKKKIRREDWAESWKRHFKPLEISPRLLVKPSWSARRGKRGQAVVILDPGLSFGTGQHPTTGFCLERLAACRNEKTTQSLLDVGCGSGILAIAAIKLGYKPVEAFDYDPEAVRIARENAAANNVNIKIARRDLTVLPKEAAKRFDVVCANLTNDLLIAHADKLLSRLASQGTLVLAGILESQFPAVRQTMKEKGLMLVADRTGGEWHSGAFQRA